MYLRLDHCRRHTHTQQQNDTPSSVDQIRDRIKIISSVEYPSTAEAAKTLKKETKTTSLFNHRIIGYHDFVYRHMCRPTTSNGLHNAKTANYERLATDVSDESSIKAMNNQQQNSLTSFIKSFLLVAFISVLMLEFSFWFPFVIPGVASAALKTYVPAMYKYDDALTKFDNTIWTYGTDYLLTAVMSILAIKCLRETAPDNCPKKNRASLRLRLYSASLLICYGISTLAGGWAHQHFTSIESLNTIRFRVFWCVCVGNVSFASGYMGLIGREVQKVFGVKGTVPLGPWWFWPVYGSYMAMACFLGYMSFKRPACDIFIAGITQFPTTLYCLATLGLRTWPSSRTVGSIDSNDSPIGLVRLPYRIMFYIGFIGNAPLLPMYPLLVQYSGMSVGGINTLLHSCK